MAKESPFLITFFDIRAIFGTFYQQHHKTLSTGLKKTGIAECDIDTFTESDFLSADVTDKPLADDIDEENDFTITKSKERKK